MDAAGGGVKEWLKRKYKDASEPEPQSKSVKFSDLLEEARAQVSPDVSNVSLASAISVEFPNSTSRKTGDRRHTYVYGIEKAEENHPDIENILTRNKYLEEQVQELQQRVEKLEKDKEVAMNADKLEHQVQALIDPTLNIFHGPNTVAHLQGFSIKAMFEEFQEHAPNVLDLLRHLGNCKRFEGGDREDDASDDDNPSGECSAEVSASRHGGSTSDKLCTATLRTATSLCTLVKCRSRKVLGLQLFLSIMSPLSELAKVITVLNHAGVCSSYNNTWKYLRQLTAESRFLEIIREGHWLWAYDNLNVYFRVRHERQDHHNKMTNLTSRLAINIRYLPNFRFSWSDCTPQRPLSSLTIDDFLPSVADASILKERAVQYIMTFLVSTFPDLKGLAKLIPPVSLPHKLVKSEIVPMKVLFKDEKYKSVTIEILEQLLIDAGLSGKDGQVIVGDQLTCKNIRGSKLWRASEIQAIDRLSWAHEMPGDFHFLWECLKVVFLTFWGTPAQAGSLSNMKEIVRRRQVDKAVKVFNVGDEFLVHCFKAQLAARICYLLKLNSVSDSIEHQISLEWLRSTAEKLVPDTLMPPQASKDPSYARHRAFLHTSFLYVDLRNAIRYEDGVHIVRMWKLWLPRFIGTGRKNYATECVHLVGNLFANLPKHLAFIAINNRTVNTQGKPGHGKPIDQMVEHYNLALKEAMRSGGANNTPEHIEEISLSGLFLMDVAKKVDKEFHAQRSSMHTCCDPDKDIAKIAYNLRENGVIRESERSSVIGSAGEEISGGENGEAGGDSIVGAVTATGVACPSGEDGAARSDAAENNIPTNRSLQSFIDPVEVGLEKLSNSTWLRDTLDRVETHETDDLQTRETTDYTNDPYFDPTYELHHVD